MQTLFGTLKTYSSFLNGFIVLDVEHDESNVCFSYYTLAINYENNVEVRNAILGHIGQSLMNRLAKEGLLGSFNKVELSTCEHCLVGKTTRKPSEKGTKTITPLKLIHSDICGPMNVKARHKAVYFLTFIDDFVNLKH